MVEFASTNIVHHNSTLVNRFLKVFCMFVGLHKNGAMLLADLTTDKIKGGYYPPCKL